MGDLEIGSLGLLRKRSQLLCNHSTTSNDYIKAVTFCEEAPKPDKGIIEFIE